MKRSKEPIAPTHYPATKPDKNKSGCREVKTASGAVGVRGYQGKPPGFQVNKPRTPEVNDSRRVANGCGTMVDF